MWYNDITMFNFIYKNIDFAHKLDKASNPTEDYSKHMHCFYEIIYFINGDVEYTVESETRRLSEGDLIMVPFGKYHFATVNTSQPYERYVLKFPVSVLPPFLKYELDKKGSFFGKAKKFELAFKQLDTYFSMYNPDELYVLFSCEIIKLLIMLCHESTNTTNQVNAIIKQLIDYIDENIREPISLESLSNDFNFSKSYISNEFKKNMRIPIMQYIRAKKIFSAHEMILSGAKKAYVSEYFGFEDYSTFYRSYVKIMGSTPNSTEKTK